MKVVLTRPPGRNDELARRLRAEGFEIAEAPLVDVEAIPGSPIRVDGYDWLVLTSATGADELFRRLEGRLPRVAVIGPATAEAVRGHGVEPAFIARRSTQEGLVAELPQPAGRVLFAGAEGARGVIVRDLGAEFVPLYRTVERRPERFPDGELVVLASPSAARSLAALGRREPCITIGPSTSAEARRHGLAVAAEATTHDLDGLVQAVKLAASSIASSRS